MMGVTDSPCDNQEDEEEFMEIANEFDGYAPTIFIFSDMSASVIVQKTRFYREADDDDIYSFEGCVVEKQKNSSMKKD